MTSGHGAGDGDGPSKTPVNTKPLDDAQRGAWFEGADTIVAFREYDGDLELELPRKGTFTLGASHRCDLAVPGRDLSAVHCLFEFKGGGRLRLHDHRSTNGTYVAGRRIEVVDLDPGDTFTCAPVTFMALNEVMRLHRPRIASLVGSGFTPSPDNVLTNAVKTSNHLLLTGELGSDLDQLARSIHAVSLRRSRTLVEISDVPSERAKQRDVLRDAARSTLVIDLARLNEPLDPTFCSMAFSPDYRIRVVVLAPTTGHARKLLPNDFTEQLQSIWLRPIAMRPGDIPALFESLLVERQASFRISDLTAQNRAALSRCEWRDNFIGLRLAADRLVAISKIRDWNEMDWRERGLVLGVAKSTLYDWFLYVGLSMPIFSQAVP